MAPVDAFSAEDVDTVIYVDIDGVLNVGARDKDDAPLLFNLSNVEFARAQKQRGQARSRSDEECVDKLISVAERELEEGGTYLMLACEKGSHVCEVLAKRLAHIIQASGSRRSVVLASNWRKPQHAARVRKLEAEVSAHLGERWAFDTRTKPADEKRAADRLRCVGDHVEALYREGAARPDRLLRVLVLEDFFITAMDGWECDGCPMFAVGAVEAYLEGRAPKNANVAVKLIHTYDEWKTPEGLRVQVGSGLTLRHTCEALSFLTGRECAEQNPTLTPIKEDHIRPSQVSKVTLLGAGKAVSQALQPKGGGHAVMDARWANYISGAWPWLSVYLPCAA